MREFYGLSPADQLLAFEQIRGYLAGELGTELTEDQELRTRRVSLEAMQRAAVHSGLKDGQRLTVKAFTEASEELGLGVSSKQVITAWQSWRQANNALAGEWVRETPTQRAHRRATSARARWTVDAIDSVRRWLATEPAGKRRADYDYYVRDLRSRQPSELRLPTASAISYELVVPWAAILAIAEERLTISDARQAHLREALAAGGGHAGIEMVALLADCRVQDAVRMVKRPAFPARVATLPPKRAVWLEADIRAFLSDQPVRHRQLDERQHSLVTSDEIERRLGYTRSRAVGRNLQREAWARTPCPDGRISGSLFWWRDRFEHWMSLADVERRVYGAPAAGSPWARERWAATDRNEARLSQRGKGGR